MKQLTFTAAAGRYVSEEVIVPKSGRIAIQFAEEGNPYEVAILGSVNGTDYAMVDTRKIEGNHVLMVNAVPNMKFKVRAIIKPTAYVQY